MTSAGEFIPEIDGLRFIAISGVILHHLMVVYLTETKRLGTVELPRDWLVVAQHSSAVTLAYAGHFGVPLFFVISGFILALPFARRYLHGTSAPSVKSYYLRRLTRIEPPYLISLVVMFVYIWATNPGHTLFIPHLLASLLYAHGLVYGDFSWINGVTWSLEVEAQFYLIVPVLVSVFAFRNTVLRRSVLIAATLFFGLLSQFVIEPSTSMRLFLSLLNYLQYFIAGFLLADLHLARQKRGSPRSYWWDPLALASGAALLALLMRGGHHFSMPFLIVGLYWGVLCGRVVNALLTLRWITVVGGMCYTLYLYHTFVIDLFAPLTMRLASATIQLPYDFGFQSVLLCSVILFICSCLFVRTEKPFMEWSRLIARREAPGTSGFR